MNDGNSQQGDVFSADLTQLESAGGGMGEGAEEDNICTACL